MQEGQAEQGEKKLGKIEAANKNKLVFLTPKFASESSRLVCVTQKKSKSSSNEKHTFKKQKHL